VDPAIMTKTATRDPKTPTAPEERPRGRLHTPAAPTLLLDLSPAFLEALRSVAPKERRPRIAYVLAVVVGVAVYVLYGALTHPLRQRVKYAAPAAPTGSAAFASPSPSTDAEQSVCGPPRAPSAPSGDDRAPLSAAASAMTADPNRSNATREPQRRASR
jgi:hypothetical protein